MVCIAKTLYLPGKEVSCEFSGGFKDSSHSSCKPLVCFALVFRPQTTELWLRSGGWVEFLPGSLNAELEEKPEELVTAVQCAF